MLFALFNTTPSVAYFGVRRSFLSITISRVRLPGDGEPTASIAVGDVSFAVPASPAQSRVSPHALLMTL